MILTLLSRQKQPQLSVTVTFLTRHLSSSPSVSKLRDHYAFQPPPSLSPDPPKTNPNPKPDKKKKPRYRPPSSLDQVKPKYSDLPFDFRFSYTESSPTVRPIGLREPKYSPFGPGRLDREWTGVCAPAVDPKVKSVEGSEDPNLENKRKLLRSRIQGTPLTEAERKFFVEKCQRNRTKRQINLGIVYSFQFYSFLFNSGIVASWYFFFLLFLLSFGIYWCVVWFKFCTVDVYLRLVMLFTSFRIFFIFIFWTTWSKSKEMRVWDINMLWNHNDKIRRK